MLSARIAKPRTYPVTPGTLPRIFRSLVPRAAVLAGSLTLAGCNSIREMTSGLTESTELPKNEGALNRFAEDWASATTVIRRIRRRR